MTRQLTSRLFLLLAAGTLHAATLTVYLSPPSHQSSSVAGVTTETFDSLPLGIDTTPYLSAIGTFQLSTVAKVDVLAADQFGGANGSDYIAIGSQSSSSSPVTLNLGGQENYFGLWWSAGDTNNGIGFYENGFLLAHFKTADIVSLLTPKNGKVTAINGTQYTNSQFYGNPNNTSQDTGEPFAYVNFVSSGLQFNQIVFDNSGTTSTGFEMDNMSILGSAPAIPTTHVLVETITETAPEPSTLTLAAAILALLVVFKVTPAKKYHSRPKQL